ncbi:cytidylyltransferase domain-containing protein [methane-oxidizing endosymbiont of Gigantopelta aegis]|uniref:acylneuraminate cytidylyltransferase family protein n=1 Tax=methane-oxidizing endosymbiont of Gigantopelta aegis TaxID=2794938 RepID=UPI0018DCA788|nr:acylneuraminate cytidylyltransferase family protein [methane-oxidizing endosymbiont of Gigantopelta aegis]
MVTYVKWQQPLGGKPLLAWTTRALRKLGRSDCLAIVSTDSKKYQALAASIGVDAPFLRPRQYSTDNASTADVMRHALNWFEAEHDYRPEQIMCLQPTSPFRRVEHIQTTLEWLEQSEAVIGCKSLHRDLTTVFFCQNGWLKAVNRSKPMQTRRQDIQSLLTPNGAMYACKSDWFMANNTFYPDNTRPLLMDSISSMDIDTETDWKIAEALIEKGLVYED